MADDAHVNVALTPELAALLDRAVASGSYATSNDVIIEALLEWKQRREISDEDRNAIRRLWDEGVASGPGRFDDMAEIKREARRQFAASGEA